MTDPIAPTETGGRQPPVKRILVVDDDVDSATSLALLLQLRGLDTRTAHDGIAALSAVEAFRPDVVLLDLSLPQIDGHEVARRIRARLGGDQLLILALTGWVLDEDRRRSHDAGFDDHLTKPVDVPALLRRLAV